MKMLFLVLIIYAYSNIQAMEKNSFLQQQNPFTTDVQCDLKYKFRCFIPDKGKRKNLGQLSKKLDEILKRLPEQVENLFFRHQNIVAYDSHLILKITFIIKVEKKQVKNFFYAYL